jgi:peroxiredoxin-like protein
MTPLPHIYEVKLAGGAEGYAQVSATGIPELRSAPPLDFDGPGDTWSPEHLFLAAVETCFLFTLRSVARASKLEFISLEMSGQGKVDREDGAMRFTEIVLRPRLRVLASTDKDRALRVLDKSERACLVSASLSTPVKLEPEVLVGEVDRATMPKSD